MPIRPGGAGDVDAITDIYNQAVVATTASFDIEPKTLADRSAWLEDRLPRHPVLVAEEDGVVLGWGALSPYSERPAYAATAEVSVYVGEAYRTRGLGRALTVALLEAAACEGLHTVLARICTENTGSIAMVRSLGFTDAGTMHEVGRKFDRWLDVATWEYLVPTSQRVAAALSGDTSVMGQSERGERRPT
jgi:phosphinothricin acetyltransferase